MEDLLIVLFLGAGNAYMSYIITKIISNCVHDEEDKKAFWKFYWIVFVANIVIVVIFPLLIAIELPVGFYGLIYLIFSKAFSSGKTNINVKEVLSNKLLDDLDNTDASNNAVSISSFPPIFYNNSEDKLLEIYIEKYLSEVNIDTNKIPRDILKRKNILSLIFALLLFVYMTLIFFHFPLYTYVIGLIILFVFYKITRKYKLMDYLKKEVKSRPSEKISNVVMSVCNSYVTDDKKNIRLMATIIAFVLPLIIFWNPKIMYEKQEGGYAVRYYIFGVTNYTTVEIPEEYKGEKVVSLRGNAFSNMLFLESAILPDTITEIRGQAFLNDSNLVEVKLPKYLERLGGSAFSGCSSLEEVILPDTLVELGGESFYEATSLKKVKLSNSLTEIRGSTFEGCTSLESIDIPDSVTRIGGHAFYGDTRLSKVNISPNSNLEEIGSSAFRRCSILGSIKLPKSVSYQSNTFKESPTLVEKYES